FDAPRRILLTPHVGQRPLAFDETFNFCLYAETSAILPRAAGILAQLPTADENRPAQFHLFDRCVANVALANGHACGFTVACRPTAPSAAFDTLRDERLLRARIIPEKNNRPAENAHMRAWKFSAKHRLQREKDGIDDGWKRATPRSHRGGMPRHHV